MRVIEQNYTDDMADAANVTGHLVNGTGGEWANWSWVQKDLSLEDQGRDSIQYRKSSRKFSQKSSRNICQKVPIKNSRNLKKSVVDTYLPSSGGFSLVY